MRKRVIALGLLLCCLHVHAATDLRAKTWNHGSEDCSKNQDPAIEVFEVDADTYVLRQNKCIHFEAPFIYVLFGEHTVFIQDTGATEDATRFPLYETVQRLIAKRGASRESLRILVTHSHSHGDHTAGDAQFRGKPNVLLIEPEALAVRTHFGFTKWPLGTTNLDLGGRELLVMPAPGHQDESVVVYDRKTQWLLTGDSVYPGMLYVRDWNVYRASIQRLVEFSKTQPIAAVMGTHIEMSKTPGKVFPRGSTFQPNELGLALSVDDLRELGHNLQRAGQEPQEITLAKFLVVPVSAFQRAIGNVLKWLGF